MKSLIVDTVPRDCRKAGAINLGMQIVRERWGADVCQWTETVDVAQYDRIGFNVYYATHALNIGPFLRRHGLEKGDRAKRVLVAGGQGVGRRGLVSGLVDEVFVGELDTECERQILSRPVVRSGRAVIEISRGCKQRCSFCEYSWGRRLRYKPLELVKRQIDEVVEAGCRKINFMSTDFAGYPQFDELVEYALWKRVSILNGDFCVVSLPRAFRWLQYFPRQIRLGVESFHEPTRIAVGKRFSDDVLYESIERVLDVASSVHLYLIFGLPGDDYGAWFRWVERLAGMRETIHTWRGVDLFGAAFKVNRKPVRIEFNVTNFEPCDGTPLEGAPLVDFAEKERFLSGWSAAMIGTGLFCGERMGYANSGGRIGRKELSYRMLMRIKRGGPELTKALLDALPYGVRTWISDSEALRFLGMAGE